MNKTELAAIASSLVAPGKGILAADESFGTIKKRLNSIDVESTEENRRKYREMLFSTGGIEDDISGVILFDETIRQASEDGTPFPVLLEQKGIIPGIKVDQGKIDLPGFPGEKITEGLDGLLERLDNYYEMGARFTKWRAVINIGDGLPTRFAIRANAHALARYAALSQAANLVPIVEPEVLMDGSHGIDRCEEVTALTLEIVFTELFEHRIFHEGMLLKPNMVLPGKESDEHVTSEEVAETTVGCFRQVVPAAVPGVVFLSGGQSAVDATVRLNAMNQMETQPWELSFSYGRALQGPALRTWHGKEENKTMAQETFRHRARCNGAARFGEYSGQMEEELAAA